MPSGDNLYPYDVFISYSHQDKDWVRNWIVPRLRTAGLTVCIDYEAFDIGKPAIVNMENAIVASRHTLLIMTPAWMQSEWAQFEGLIVQQEDPAGILRRTLPVLLKPCSLPRRIGMLTYADFTSDVDQEVALARLVDALLGVRNIPDAQTIPHGYASHQEKTKILQAINGDPVFSFRDAAWVQFTKQMDAYRQDRDKRIPKLFGDIETRIFKVVNRPGIPFYDTAEWRDLNTAVKNLSGAQPSPDEQTMKLLIIDQLGNLIRLSADRAFQSQNWRDCQALYEFYSVLEPNHPQVIHNLEFATQKIEEAESLKAQHYELLEQAIRERDRQKALEILNWFSEIDINYRNVSELRAGFNAEDNHGNIR